MNNQFVNNGPIAIPQHVATNNDSSNQYSHSAPVHNTIQNTFQLPSMSTINGGTTTGPSVGIEGRGIVPQNIQMAQNSQQPQCDPQALSALLKTIQ